MPDTKEHAAIVSSKGQVVVPGEVRRRLGLTQGSVLRFMVEGDSVRLLAAVGDIRRLKGRLTTPQQQVSLQDMEDTIARRRAQAGRSR